MKKNILHTPYSFTHKCLVVIIIIAWIIYRRILLYRSYANFYAIISSLITRLINFFLVCKFFLTVFSTLVSKVWILISFSVSYSSKACIILIFFIVLSSSKVWFFFIFLFFFFLSFLRLFLRNNVIPNAQNARENGI